MKGSKGLASKFCGRRCRTAKTRSRWVGGSFYVLPSEIDLQLRSETVPRRKVRTCGCGVLGITPDSDVTHRVKTMTNAGATAAAGLVPGAVLVSTVIQMP